MSAIYFHEKYNQKDTITQFERANSQLENTVFQQSPPLVCIFTSDEKEQYTCDKLM